LANRIGFFTLKARTSARKDSMRSAIGFTASPARYLQFRQLLLWRGGKVRKVECWTSHFALAAAD
jgi:hypothetical protein